MKKIVKKLSKVIKVIHRYLEELGRATNYAMNR